MSSTFNKVYGTHGIIEGTKDDTKVQKKYIIYKNTSNDLEILDSSFEKSNYEYNVQKTLCAALENTDNTSIIKVPKVYNFSENDKNCVYTMDRIYPIPGYDKLIHIDLHNGNTFRNEHIGYTMGYNRLLEDETINIFLKEKKITPELLAFEIGKLYSLLHYSGLNKISYDGYDCELVLGMDKDKNMGFYFIDFDKCSCFNLNLNKNFYRKIDEKGFEKKNINSIKKLSYFLNDSLSGMLLLPSDNNILIESFLNGYKIYIEKDIQKEVYNNLVSEILSWNNFNCNGNYENDNWDGEETQKFIRKYTLR